MQIQLAMYGAVCRPATRVSVEYFTACPTTYAEGILLILLSQHTQNTSIKNKMENTTNDSNVTSAMTCTYNYCTEDTLYHKIMGSILFLIVWPFIVLDMKWFPLGRPAAALVGATFMVIFLVVPQDQVFHILGDKGILQTICLLLGMMLLSYYYDREGLLCIAALWIFGSSKPFKHVLWKICVLSALLSAIITNDATCLVITPLLVNEHTKQKRSQKEHLPLLLGIATSANIGSAATFFGNPQNAFIAANSRGKVSLITFFATTLPAAILGLALSILFLYLMYFKTVFGKSANITDNNHQTAAGIDSDAVQHNLTSSLSVSREEMAMSYDQSDKPHLSSQASQERKRMYATASYQHPDSGILKSRSRYSLPPDFRSDLSRNPRETSLSNPNLSSCYGETQDSSRQRNSQSTMHQDQRGSHPLPDVSVGEAQPAATEANVESGVVVETVSFKKRSWRQILFTIWLIVITIVVVALLAVPPLQDVQFNLGLVPLGSSILTMLVDTILNRKYPYDAITKIDWAVILLFMGLFVWLGGFENTRIPNLIFDKILPYMDLFRVEGVLLFTAIVVVGSNILSNVPLVILVVAQLFNFNCGDGTCTGQLTGVLLAWVSTIAGNFTLIGSIANLIVAEKARSCVDYRLTFWGYLKFGFVSTLVVLFAGLPIVYFAGKYVNLSMT